ncbi:DUF4190 domain-containing protein [Prosthecobacter sp. SYSU 5D2]|uniref:DUF4190 domain-containing protein n=1 Tax=Prosthecobacter sp. SYSU 5D2 TaxID=3134134 RepID=UPI0031FF02BE
MNASGQFHLQWRGQRFGPWDLAEIREALKNGTIHSLYQIHAGGQWQPLRDFLDSLPRPAEASKVKPEVRPQETAEETSGDNLEDKPAVQPVSDAASTQKLELGDNKPTPLSAWALSPAEYMKLKRELEQPGGAFTDANWHAIACLILSLCFWIPYVSIISWLLSLVFGHIALVQISFQPGLGGRSLALTGLAISYAVMIFGLGQIFLKPFFFLQP